MDVHSVTPGCVEFLLAAPHSHCEPSLPAAALGAYTAPGRTSPVSQPLIPAQQNYATPSRWCRLFIGIFLLSVELVFPSQLGLSWRYYYSLLSISRCGRRSIHTLCWWTVPYALQARGRWRWHTEPTFLFAPCRKLGFDAATRTLLAFLQFAKRCAFTESKWFLKWCVSLAHHNLPLLIFSSCTERFLSIYSNCADRATVSAQPHTQVRVCEYD